MKKLVFGLALLAFCSCILKKRTAETAKDPALDKRLGEFLQHYKELDMDSLINYIYPKVFTITPRDSVLNRMKKSVTSDEANLKIDSIRIESMYPVFIMDNGRYAKISYSMVMQIDMGLAKDSTINKNSGGKEPPKGHVISSGSYPAPRGTLIKTLLAGTYGEENVSVDEATGIARVRATSQLVAIKDEYAKEWSFLNLRAEDSLANDKLLGKKVLDKLATYK